MARETIQREKPVGSESDGPFNFGSRGKAVNGDNHLEHTARLGPSATGDLVNSKTQEIYDAEI